jgi:hypothetical protein
VTARWIALASSILLASPAAAVDFECSGWTRLSEDQKVQAIGRAIQDVVSSSKGRQYTSINRTQTRRCLERQVYPMLDDFDELCSRGMRADMQALNTTFRSYVWSCAR